MTENKTSAEDARALDMSMRWAEGETLADIGHVYSVTRERVRQIVKKAGLVTAADARRARRDRLEAERERTHDELLDWLAINPGRTRAEASSALGVSTNLIGELLGGEAFRLFVTTKAAHPSIADDDILEGLQQAANVHGNPLAADRYDEYCPQHGLVSSIRIIQRWGTWNAACAAAGLTLNAGRRTYARRWTEGQMLERIADYLQSEGSRGSYHGYDAFARVTAGAPSAQTVRNAFHDWTNAKAAAQLVVTARERRLRVA